MARIIFNGTPRLIRELAKVNFEGMRRRAEHVDICACTKDARLQTSNNHCSHFWMLKTQSLNGIGEFDIHRFEVRDRFAGGDKVAAEVLIEATAIDGS